MRKHKIVLFDTETTGTGEEDQIIQVGSLMLSTLRTYKSEEFVKHDTEISIDAMKVHGIRKVPKDATKLSKTKTIKRINNLKKGDIVCGHNIDFDLMMAKDAITNDKFDVIDTMIVAEFMKEVGMLKEDDKVSLQYLRYLWLTQEDEDYIIKKYKPEGGAHSALFDVLITNALLEIMANEIATMYLNDGTCPWIFMKNLYKDRFNPDRVWFPFGKYKNYTVDWVYQSGDTSYLEWFYENVDGCERQKRAIDIMVEEHNKKQEK